MTEPANPTAAFHDPDRGRESTSLDRFVELSAPKAHNCEDFLLAKQPER